jgi:uncharacterized repeat protein (TIGR01451 family)
VKTADVATLTTAGQAVTYSFLVTNTGNVALSSVTVEETEFSGSGPTPTITCPAAAASLAPAAQVTCTATYTVTQADVDSGALANTATATGTPPAGNPPVSPPSEAVVDFPATPGIMVSKSVTPTVVISSDQDVSYSFVVTNTGNVTLSAVTVTETAFSGSGPVPVISCPSGTLAPAATMTCTAPYTTTVADIDAGEITNTAVATGTPPVGTAITSDPSMAAISVFRITMPLSGGTSSEQVVLLGGVAVVVALLIALWHVRRLHRDAGEIARRPTPSSPSSSSPTLRPAPPNTSSS